MGFYRHTCVFSLLLLICWDFSALASDPNHFGEAVKVEGEVKVTRRFKRKVITKNDVLLIKDKITTGAGASLEIQMGKKNNLFIAENSKLTLNRPTADGKKKEIMIKLMAGTIRSKLDGLKETGEVFSIRSPTAVAGVRGTDFVTGYNPGLGAQAFSLTVLEGSVEVSGIDKATQKATQGIRVMPSQKITVSETGEVQDVVKVTPQEMNQLKETFSVSTDDVQEGEQDKKEDSEGKAKDEDDGEKEEEKDEANSDEKEEKDGTSDENDSENKKDEDSSENEQAGDESSKDKDTSESDEKEGGETEGDDKPSAGTEDAQEGDGKNDDDPASSGDDSSPKASDDNEVKDDGADSSGTSDGQATEDTSRSGGEPVAAGGETPPANDGESGVATQPSGETTVGASPSLEVETVESVGTEEAPEVDASAGIDGVGADAAPTVEVDADIDVDLEQVESTLDQTSSVVEDVVDDQVQDQIDAINQEVGRTLQLIIRQGD